jgi:hypothetical protein
MYATRSITRTILPSSVCAAGVTGDPLTYLLGQVQPGAVALQLLDHSQRVLVVTKAHPEVLFQAVVEHLLADVPERRVPEVVAEADRLHQILVQSQRAGNRARDRGDLERVSQPCAVVIALRRHEHLRLVLQPAERLAVHDSVAVALERSAQRAVLLCPCASCGVGARRQRRQRVLLQLALSLGEDIRDRVGLLGEAHPSIVAAAAASTPGVG